MLAQAQTRLATTPSCARLVGLPRTAGFPQDTRPVTARVIGSSPTEWYSTVEIDKGSGDGIKVDMPVITGQGLFGKVTLDHPRHLGRHADHRRLERGLRRGRAGRRSGRRRARRRQPERHASRPHPERQLHARRATRSSPPASRSDKLESLFPRGIPIGRVNRVDNNEVTLYQLVHIQPFADFHTLGLRPGAHRADADLAGRGSPERAGGQPVRLGWQHVRRASGCSSCSSSCCSSRASTSCASSAA